MGDYLNSVEKLQKSLGSLTLPSHLVGPKLPSTDELAEMMRNYNHADYQYEVIRESIKEFEDELDENLEVAIHLAAFGQSIVMQVSELGYSNPSLIHFYGYVNGAKSHLIQHVNQLSFLLTSVPKSDPQKPARRIGYIESQD